MKPQRPERARLVHNVRTLPVRSVIFVIELYRHMVSPLRLPSCRFIPSCSQYAVDALREYGLIGGSRLSIVRLAKCGPWHRGGWDPIPERAGYGSDGCNDSAVWDTRAKQRESGSVV